MKTLNDRHILITRHKRAGSIQYRHELKEEVVGFIPKPVARPKYGTKYQHKGMLLQNLHRIYLYILIKLPHLKDLEQRIPSFPECANYGALSANNPDPRIDDIPTNDNGIHQIPRSLNNDTITCQMISEINVEREKSDRLTLAKLNTVKQHTKQDHKSHLMTQKYSYYL